MKRTLLFFALFFIISNLFAQITDNHRHPFDQSEDFYITPPGYATWDDPSGTDENRDLLGYNIYLDGVFIGYFTEFYIQMLYYFFVPEQSYIIGIQAVYTGGAGPLIEFIYMYNPDLNSVQDFSVTNSGYVSWDPPIPSDNSRELLGYNIYLGVDFVSFTTDLFYQYDENSLIPEQTYVSGVTAVYDEGESSTEFGFFNYSLNNPIIIVDPEEIYVTLNPDESIDVDLTVSNPGSDVLFFNIEVLDAPWILINPNVYYSVEAGEFIVVSIPISAAGLEDITLTAELIFENNAGQDVIVPVTMVVTGNAYPATDVLAVVNVENTEVSLTWNSPLPDERDLESYNVYRFLEINSAIPFLWELISEGSADTSFVDTDWVLLEPDFYQYAVKAVYANGIVAEAAFSNVVEKLLVFNPPQNLYVVHTYSFFNNIYHLYWEVPEPCNATLINYNIYVNYEVYVTVSDNILDYLIINAPTMPLTAESIFYITALYENPNGESEPSNIVICIAMCSSEQNIVSSDNLLIGNYPNPFHPETTISFSLTTEFTENTELIIYNLKGQKIRELKIENLKLKINKVIWDGTDDNNHPVSSGIYFYQLKVGNQYSETKRMLLLK